jgi:homoserine kinase type II
VGDCGILTLNAVTQLDDLHLEETLANYSLGRLLRHWPAANGIENSNYFIETMSPRGQRDFVLTIMEQQPNAGSAYVSMMQTLDKSGLPVAAPVPDLEGQYITQTLAKPTMLQPRLMGQHVYNPTEKQVCALARYIARMHLAMQNTTIELPEYPRNVQWLTAQTAKYKNYLPFNDQSLLSNTLREVTSLLQRGDVNALPQGMIHGDLFRDNVLFNEYGLSGVLDFHHAARGYWIYDLAVAANDWCTDSTGMLDPDRTTAMLRAYHSIRPLHKEELWFFSCFALYAALAFWLSRLSVTLQHSNNTALRFKNPDEFKRIVAYHTRHSFYLDPRSLT